MVKRIAIVVGGMAAAAVLTVGLVVAGLGPVRPSGSESVVASTEDADAPVQAAAALREPEVVYVKPARKRRTIVVERPTARVSTNAGTASSRVRTVRVRSEREDRDREDREDRDGEDREDREDREDHDD
jgi:hypothetical protein